MAERSSQSGQALVEFITCAMMIGIISIGSWKLFYSSWSGLRCHLEAFEQGRKELDHQAEPTTVVLQKHCGSENRIFSLTLEPLETLLGNP